MRGEVSTGQPKPNRFLGLGLVLFPRSLIWNHRQRWTLLVALNAARGWHRSTERTRSLNFAFAPLHTGLDIGIGCTIPAFLANQIWCFQNSVRSFSFTVVFGIVIRVAHWRVCQSQGVDSLAQCLNLRVEAWHERKRKCARIDSISQKGWISC